MLLRIGVKSSLHPFMFLRDKMHTPGRFYTEYAS